MSEDRGRVKKMTRQECEKAIIDKLIEIADIYKEYNPDGDYLSLTVNNRLEDGNGSDYGDWDTRQLSVNNRYWEDKKPILCGAYIDIEDEKYTEAMEKLYAECPEERGNYPIEWSFRSMPERHLKGDVNYG